MTYQPAEWNDQVRSLAENVLTLQERVDRGEFSVRQLIDAGYCRVSNRYHTVVRIDHDDWVYILARRMRRAVADFYIPNDTNFGKDPAIRLLRTPSPTWCDYYRRCISGDKLVLCETAFRMIPGSGHNGTHYLPPLV